MLEDDSRQRGRSQRMTYDEGQSIVQPDALTFQWCPSVTYCRRRAEIKSCSLERANLHGGGSMRTQIQTRVCSGGIQVGGQGEAATGSAYVDIV